MLQFKLGVSIKGLQPELLVGLLVAEGVWEKHDKTLTVTSVMDGQHSTNSLHYQGLACDCRTKDIFDEYTKDSIFLELTAALHPLGFDVVFESRGKESEHVHLEYQPK